MNFKFNNVEEATRCLLGESITIINQHTKDYVIIGGWSPFLRYNHSNLHPGTKDVDVLFHDAAKEDALSGVFLDFFDKGFLMSAKHEFQLIKIYNVSGKKFAFNVDILHPTKYDHKFDDDMFVKQLDLKVPLSSLKTKTFLAKSIVQPNAENIFTEKMHSSFKVNYRNSNGQEEDAQFELLDDIGCIFSKAISCQSVKRQRDSFDIFLTIKYNENYGGLIERIKDLKKSESSTYNSFIALKEFYKKNDTMYNNTKKFIKDMDQNEFNHVMMGFFKDAEID